MLAEIVLTPSESKKLISLAILELPVVKNAFKDGIVALHPSSTTVFLYKEIVGRWPQGVWVSGVVAPQGLCSSLEMVRIKAARPPGRHDSGKNLYTWFFKKGVLQEPIPLNEILSQMGPEDIYVKGANALDPQGNVGVLYASPTGGTIVKVIAAQRKRGFHLLFAIGLEKLIPVSIAEASRKAKLMKVNKAMGIPCGMIPVQGDRIDEVRALKVLCRVDATPIAAGGLGGAEGSTVLALSGSEPEVQRCMEMLKTLKGARLPVLNLPDCDSCIDPGCHLARGRCERS